MKKIISIIILLFIIVSITGCTDKSKPELTEQIKKGFRTDAKEFLESLKSILVKEMQTNGIVNAVSVCSDTAQILTNNYGISKGIYIKRVSFKNRNENNKPNKIEADALKVFEDLKQKGELIETTEYFTTVNEDGITSVIYLKPIIVQAPCLSCHGDNDQISAEVNEILKNKYPNDKATGYQIDDLRGALSIKKTL
jgi:hypothetical protein